MSAINNYKKLVVGFLILTIAGSASASKNLYLEVSNYKEGDSIIVINNGRTYSFSPSQLNRAKFNDSSEVCYMSAYPKNKITLSIRYKTSSETNYRQITAGDCSKLVSWYSGITATIKNLSDKIFNKDETSITANTKSGNIVRDTTSENPLLSDLRSISCLAGAANFQLLQPKFYSELIIPIRHEYNGFKAQIQSSQSSEALQKSTVNNSIVRFKNIDLLENRDYRVIVIGYDDKPISNHSVTIYPYDINSDKLNKSNIIPYLEKDDSYDLSQNEVIYDITIFNDQHDKYAYLYLNSLNSLVDTSKYLTKTDRNATLGFVESYIDHHCKDTIKENPLN